LNSLGDNGEYICAERAWQCGWSSYPGIRVKTCGRVLKTAFVSRVVNYAYHRAKIAEN
jgi:hypothetical protein